MLRPDHLQVSHRFSNGMTLVLRLGFPEESPPDIFAPPPPDNSATLSDVANEQFKHFEHYQAPSSSYRQRREVWGAKASATQEEFNAVAAILFQQASNDEPSKPYSTPTCTRSGSGDDSYTRKHIASPLRLRGGLLARSTASPVMSWGRPQTLYSRRMLWQRGLQPDSRQRTMKTLQIGGFWQLLGSAP
jgi:hypothetical protein